MATGDKDKIITIDNAHTCSPFELRQELVRRGAFDLDEKTINFRSLLQRLMQELVADEEKKADEKISQAVDEASREREKAKELRELRKKEALERSKQRQSDPNYFQQRKELNEEKLSVKSTQVAPSETISKSDSADDATEECSEMSSQDDPFRSYKNKSRSKIFVR